MNLEDNTGDWIELDPIERQCIFEDYKEILEKDSDSNNEIKHKIENYNYD